MMRGMIKIPNKEKTILGFTLGKPTSYNYTQTNAKKHTKITTI